MKKLYFLIIALAFVQALTAQQEHHYTQFMYNKLMLNPAYAGVRGVPSIMGLLRSQWVGFDGAPKSQLIGFNTPVRRTRIGLGATLTHQKIGLSRVLEASLAYSYKLIGTKKFSLRAGVMGSFRSLSLDFEKAYPLVVVDQSLTDKMINNRYINVGAGLYAYAGEQFYVGASVPRLIGNIFGIKNPDAQLSAQEYRHFYLTAGGSIRINETLRFMPAVLLKYVKNAPFDADVNFNLDIKKKTTLGLSYRLGGDGPGESVDLLFYRQLSNRLGIGAAYDMTFSEIRNYESGSFEVLVQYDLLGKRHSMTNPRFFF